MNRWGHVAKLTPSAPTSAGTFGRSIAVYNRTIVVGDLGNNEHGAQSGAIYVFEPLSDLNGIWTEVAKLFPNDLRSGDAFGNAIDIWQDTIVAGAFASDERSRNQGAVYVFERLSKQQNVWDQTAHLTSSNGGEADHFGCGVAIDGDLIAACMCRSTGNPLADRGTVYVYRRGSAPLGQWHEIATLRSGDWDPGDNFGLGLGLSNRTLLIGAPGDDELGQDAGAAYFYELIPEPSSGCLLAIGSTILASSGRRRQY